MSGRTTGSTPSVSKSMPVVSLLETSSLQPLSVPRHPTSESMITSSSIASHDSFMTALTSDRSPSSPTPPSRLKPSSPHSLRKSISVDSFINIRRSTDLSEPGPSSSGHSYDNSSESFLPSITNHIDLEDWKVRPRYTATNGQHLPSSATSKALSSRVMGRARGHSLSSHSTSDYDDPFLDDSDHERVEDIAHLPLLPSQRAHPSSSAALNGIGKGKAKARPGDVLLLPPRTQTLSTASSASSLNSVANGVPFTDSVPPVPPIPHFHHRRPNVPGPLVMPRRPRSGSLTAKNGTSYWGCSDVLFSIAVVGAPGCGKTTVIKKGLRSWGVTEESICTVSTSKGRIRYGSRTINAPRDEEKTAHVLELDSDVLSLDTPNGAWPPELPRIDGVLVCYDASDPASFARVPDLLACYHALHLSAVAMACKCDLEKKVPPHHASERAAPYNVGLVEVTYMTDLGRRKMRHCFHWIIRAVEKSKRGEIPTGYPYRNPASPDILNGPWSEGSGYPTTTTSARSRVSTPSGGSPSTVTKPRDHPFAMAAHKPASPTPGSATPTIRSPSMPTSPTRVRSTNDLISEVGKSRQGMRHESLDSRGCVLARTASTGSLHETVVNHDGDGNGSLERKITGETKKSEKCNDPPPMVWATREELLDKLFFLAVSGDDPTFIKYFFLTYRRFATPRSILLGMQKRVRQLNQEHSGLLIGSYAQMRICDMLEGWIEDYPTDFATPGTSGAINALIKQISSNPCTLHYGSDILPFIEELPTLQDVDTSWSIQEDSQEDSDEDGVMLLEDEDDDAARKSVMNDSFTTAPVANTNLEVKPRPSTRERKGSLPLSARSISLPLSTTLSASSDSSTKTSGSMPKRNSLKELAKLAVVMSNCDSSDIAQQITKIQSAIFLEIEPRQWLRYTMGDAKSYPGEPITASANFYNQLANWVSSLILAHDKVKLRARQVERFIELAAKLRTLNNYVGLRAVKTGINNATYPNDEIMAMLKDNNNKCYRQFLGWEILLNSVNNHRAYRMAIRHTTGPGIPDMEVHTFDMVRANDSNVDWKDDDHGRIHWGKFTLMARMIFMLQGLQEKIRSSGQYEFPERMHIREMLMNDVMDVETMRSRVFPPPDDAEPIFPLSQQTIESPNAARTEAARFKRLFFW